MPNLDDFYAFKNTSGNSGDNQPGGPQGCITVIFVALCVLWVIGKFCG